MRSLRYFVHCFLFLLGLYRCTISAKEDGTLTALTLQLQEAAVALRGDDVRLVRWDVTDHTESMQASMCPSVFPMAMNAILTYVNPMSSHLYELDYVQKQKEVEVIAAALQVCILCITNHPVNRAAFSEMQHAEQSYTIQASIVTLLHVPELAAAAAHLIWIATYANAANHAKFLHAKVVAALSTLILNAPGPQDNDENESGPTKALTIMWAAAALQNLAASYCTSADGGCYWEWTSSPEDGESHERVLQLSPDMGELLADGTEVRLAVTPSLLLRLLQWSCHGPVTGEMSHENPFPGENAESAQLEHEQSRNIVPWAATGALANLALHAEVGRHLASDYGEVLPCFCYMSLSSDWLEAAKGQIMLHHLRPDSETCCSFIEPEEEEDEESLSLCIDQVFTDGDGNTCAEYGDAVTEEECLAPDATDPAHLANMACCACGGGDTYVGKEGYRSSLHEPIEEWDEEGAYPDEEEGAEEEGDYSSEL